MYLLWPDAPRSRADVADAVLGGLAKKLLDLGPLRLSIDVRDPESDIPAPVPTPEGELPADALVSLWLDAVDQRAPYEEVLARRRRPHGRIFGRGVAVPRLRRESMVGAALLARRGALARRLDGRPAPAAPRPIVRGVDDAVAHPHLTDHRGDPAEDALRAQRRLPACDRRGPAACTASWRRHGPLSST